MDYKILHEALSRKREHGSAPDAEFAGLLVRHLASYDHLPQFIDAAGNICYKVGESKTLFAAHIDSAHTRDNSKNSYKLYKSEKVRFKKNSMAAWQNAYAVTADGDCLGADDGAGVMLLCHMMQSYVPGTYLFTRGEECGGVGATFVAENNAKFLKQFDRAICFDRRGYSDVITHQGGTRCASTKFGEALSDALNDNGMLYQPSDEGIYTDCKEWIDFIPECVNISTGYFKEHGPSEWLNLAHLRALAKAVLDIPWESLPTERDPTAYEDVCKLPTRSLSDRRINELFTKQLSVEDFEDVVEMAIDGDDSLLLDLFQQHYGLSMSGVMKMDCTHIRYTEYHTALNMGAKAGIEYLYRLSQPAATTH